MPAVPRARSRRGAARPSVSAWIAAASAATALALPAPYLLEGPGPAIDVLGEADGHPVLTVDGASRADPGEGALDMTTVMVSGPPTGSTSVLELASALVDPRRDTTPRELVYPTGVSADQVSESNAGAMTASQDLATAAALHELGRDYGRGLAVREFAPDSPARDVLRAGDEVLAAGGTPVDDVAALRSAVDAAGPGPVALRVLRDGVETDVEVPVRAAPEGAGQAWQIGVFLETVYDFPVDVEISLEDIGGPSAGTMFALAVLERLTPGAMTGGAHIAGTGTITEEGQVGPIGGIAQKVRGAADAGAAVFLAPAANCADLDGRVPEGIAVYAVDTLTTARGVVEAVGRGETPDGVPTCG
ncbi:PDZ domain-containing protein [Micrococcus antarcticus]|uniref:YlbL family protein n=1 Tax=Micrococcus antarcticus TaxID=86171 RepID=UPI00384BAAA2